LPSAPAKLELLANQNEIAADGAAVSMIAAERRDDSLGGARHEY
jgi:hypothetical protein